MERRRGPHEDADRAARFRRQLQAASVAVVQAFEGADRRADRRAAQRLGHGEQRVAWFLRANDDRALRIEAELVRRRRIKTTLVVRDEQRLAFAARVLRQHQSKRPRAGAGQARQQFDERTGGEPVGKQLRQTGAERNRRRRARLEGRFERPNAVRQNTDGFECGHDEGLAGEPSPVTVLSGLYK